MSYDYAIKASTARSLARAYREYCTDVQNSYAALMAMTQHVISADEVMGDEQISQVIKNYNSKLSYSTPYVTTFGTMTLGSYLSMLNRSATLGNENDSVGSVDGVELGTMPEDMSIRTLLSDMQATYHAITVEVAVGTALEDPNMDVTDKLTQFRDSVAQVFKSAYTDLSARMSAVVEYVRSGCGIREYLASMLESSGLIDAAENNSIFAMSSAYKYTGASPASAFTFRAVENVVAGAVEEARQFLAQAVCTVFIGFYVMRERARNAIRSKIRQTLVDPCDLQVQHELIGNNTIDKTYLLKSMTVAEAGISPAFRDKLTRGPIYFDMLPCEVIVQLGQGSYPDISLPSRYDEMPVRDLLQVGLKIHGLNYDPSDSISDLADRYEAGILADTGNLLAALNALRRTGSDPRPTLQSAAASLALEAFQGLNVNVLIRPKVLNPVLFESSDFYSLITQGGNKVGEMSYASAIDTMASLYDSGILYDVDANDERELYKGLLAGRLATSILLNGLAIESLGRSLDQRAILVPTAGNDIISPVDAPVSEITNADFYKAATSVPVSFWVPSDFSIYYQWLDQFSFSSIVSIFNNIFDTMAANPLTAPFWPYQHRMCAWATPTYRIRTDKDNTRAFNNFIAGAIIVALVATAVIAGTILLGKACTTAIINQQAAFMSAATAAQNGQLTSAHVAAYKRASRKANFLSWLAGDLTSSAAGAIDSSGAVLADQLSQIANLITGEPLE